MSTFGTHKFLVPLMLDSIITSKTRLRLLIKFFINVGTHGHLRGLAEELGESTNSIRKELNNLAGAGYLNRLGEGNKIDYSANPTHPLFKTLQSIVRTHIGLDTILTSVLERMGQVDQLVVVGDYASGIDSGTIEMVIVGNVINQPYLEQLSPKIQSLIDRKVSFHLQEEAWLGKGIVLYDKIEKAVNENVKVDSRSLKIEEFVEDTVMEK
jgi:hypothetical protein